MRSVDDAGRLSCPLSLWERARVRVPHLCDTPIMPNQTEPTVNAELGKLLQGMMRTCLVRSEHTGLIADQPGAQIDNLITAVGRSPVAVEAEFMPNTGEADAMGRLGKSIVDQPRPVEAAIALRYPSEFKSVSDLESALLEAKFSYCVFYDELDKERNRMRFPASGWLNGSIDDLADLVQLVSVPQKAVNVAADSLQTGIARTAGILDEQERLRPAMVRAIADLLGLRNVPQTRRMACAIVANALIFHERIAGMHDGLRPLEQVCGPNVGDRKRATLAAWRRILEINYYPIFAVAKDIVEQMPASIAADILLILHGTAQTVDAAGLNNARDLTGQIFQRLIVDRKFLATFYTLPASASLLARVAVAKLHDIDWSDASTIGNLRIGDFACGTGALLSEVYGQIGIRHERAGGDPENLHKVMMEHVLYGIDVMPSAVHISAATLAGARPNLGYDSSKLYTAAYGRQQDGGVKIGSLELLKDSVVRTTAGVNSTIAATVNPNDDNGLPNGIKIQDDQFDLIIMNPPFTSNTKHFGADDGVSHAAFAAFNATEADQDDMAARLKEHATGTAYHGHAGLGSAFAEIVFRKLKPGGVLAMVLLFTAMNGASWNKFRRLIGEKFEDVTILSIAANGHDMSFSSDTGVAECLVIARKRHESDGATQLASFTSLKERPRGLAEAAVISSNLMRTGGSKSLADGPFGGDVIKVGEMEVGETIVAPIGDHASGWGAARLNDATVAQVAHGLSNGSLWLPGVPKEASIKLVPLAQVGTLGVHDSMLTMKTHKGPFRKGPPSPTATYPSLCNHDAEYESRLVCRPDSQMRVKKGNERRAVELWKTASRSHLNRDFTFGAQALAVAFTDDKSLGGRVWPNIKFEDSRFDFAFALWGNSTLGLLSYWWLSSRQQSSKASLTRLMIPQLPILDFRTLTEEQVKFAEETFNVLRELDLQPAYLADADPYRALLDYLLLREMLCFDQSVYEGVRLLAAKWCAEPSVHGGKARPPDARFVS